MGKCGVRPAPGPTTRAASARLGSVGGAGGAGALTAGAAAITKAAHGSAAARSTRPTAGQRPGIVLHHRITTSPSGKRVSPW